MTFYRAIKNTFDYFSGCPVNLGELFTIRERNTVCPYVPDSAFELISLSSHKTTRVFGSRYPVPEAYPLKRVGF